MKKPPVKKPRGRPEMDPTKQVRIRTSTAEKIEAHAARKGISFVEAAAQMLVGRQPPADHP